MKTDIDGVDVFFVFVETQSIFLQNIIKKLIFFKKLRQFIQKTLFTKLTITLATQQDRQS